jgi:DNA-binding response OmpR family regulator
MGNFKALIIDDEPDICFLLKNLLQKRKFDVKISHTLRDGLINIGEFSPQILFLDVNLPDGSGLELLKTIKHDNPQLKVVMISAYDGYLERNKAKENGANFFLSKPLDKELILDALDVN